ncbi:uncharacterized protein LOC132786761 [Drosophila nasuta]|uniref:uncharacterized protein LOC132786761 n=1 Tax=Drosophila nasuta TaxID=42062 RepID=UPI00295ED11D|nr:uncharacterized protein LOC132786761 [Drosophila nasuta]
MKNSIKALRSMWHAATLLLVLLLFCLGNMPPHAAAARHSRIELATLEAVASDNLAELHAANMQQPATDDTKSTDNRSQSQTQTQTQTGHKATDLSPKNDQSSQLTLANTKSKLVDGKYRIQKSIKTTHDNNKKAGKQAKIRRRLKRLLADD